MSHLTEIAARHRPDRRRDILFIVGAALLTALAIASVTSKVVSTSQHQWTLTVLESGFEVVR